jgi:hypothetical protein
LLKSELGAVKPLSLSLSLSPSSPPNCDNDKSKLPGRMWDGSGEDTICKYTDKSKLIKNMRPLKEECTYFKTNY